MAPKVAPTGSWKEEVEREARILRREAENKQRRASNELDREVAREMAKLSREKDVISVSDTRFDGFVTDGAGIEWKWDEKTRWLDENGDEKTGRWWWLDEHGDWQCKGHSWTRLPRKVEVSRPRKTEEKRSARPQRVTDGAGLEWKWDEKTRWWWWLDEYGAWQSKGRSWTRPSKGEVALPRKTEAKSDANDAASESGASSVSTVPTLSWPKKEEKVVVQKQRPCAWDKPLAVAAAPAPEESEEEESESEEEELVSEEEEVEESEAEEAQESEAPAPAPAHAAAHAPAPASPEHLAEVSTNPTNSEKPSLSYMVATIRGELGLDDSLTMAQVIEKANHQLNMPAEGNLAKQASSLFSEITLT